MLNTLEPPDSMSALELWRWPPPGHALKIGSPSSRDPAEASLRQMPQKMITALFEIWLHHLLYILGNYLRSCFSLVLRKYFFCFRRKTLINRASGNIYLLPGKIRSLLEIDHKGASLGCLNRVLREEQKGKSERVYSQRPGDLPANCIP